jgi:hypothetical protein
VPEIKPEPRTEANWQALGDFLALAESIGRVGGALSEQAPVGPDGTPPVIEGAIQDAYRALRILAQRTGVQLDL